MTKIVNLNALFVEAAQEVDGKTIPPVTKDTVISKLGLDSVALMELVAYIEEKLDVRIPDEDLSRMKTVGDLGVLAKKLVAPGTEIVVD